jgi:2-oxoglutarate dehydrogenase E1 component
MIEAPVFHVNGDDPEACVRVARIAFEYREAFHKDVVIDMVCYRRRGHNEGDEPAFTQPLMYKLIGAKRTTRTLYTEALVGRGDITPEEAQQVQAEYQAELEAVFASVANHVPDHDPNFKAPVPPAAEAIATAIPEALAREIAATQVATPEGFNLHPKMAPQLAKRPEMLNDGTIDWSMGELLAFGSILKEGHPIRLAGQDSRRGTFSNRHAVIVDAENANEWTPLR